MNNKTTTTRRRFNSSWDEIEYLYHKVLHWFYDRENASRALPFASRLERLLETTPSNNEHIFAEECLSLLREIKGDLPGAIKHRIKEIGLIRKLHEITSNSSNWDYVARHYGYSDLSDRLDLLAILYHDSGQLEKAIRVLGDSKCLCKLHRMQFDGADLLREYRKEQDLSKPVEKEKRKRA